MATDVEALLLRIEASATKLEKDMAKVGKTFDQGARKMEARAEKLGSKLSSSMTAKLGETGAAMKELAGILAAKFSYDALKETVKHFADVADAAAKVGISAEDLQAFQFAAEQSGGSAQEFTDGMLKFSKEIGEIGDKSSKLAQLFRENGVAITEADGRMRPYLDLLEEFAGLVDRAATSSDAAAIAAIGFGKAGAGMVPTLKGIAGGIDGVREKAAEAGIVLSNEMVKKADELDDKWNAAAARMKREFAEIILIEYGLADGIELWKKGLSSTVDIVKELYDWYTKMPNIAEAGRFPEDLKTVSDKQDREVKVTKTSSENAAKAALSKQLNSGQTTPDLSGWMDLRKPRTKVPVIVEKAKKGAAEKDNEYEKELEQMAKKAKSLELEISLIGKSAEEQAKAREELELKNAAEEAGIALTPEILAQIDQVASAYARQVSALEQVKKAHEDTQRAAEHLGESAVDALSDIIIEGRDAGEVMQNLAKSLAKAALQSLLMGSGPLGGLLGGGLFKSLFAGVGGATGAPLNITPFASGGVVSRPTLAMAGEAGPEAFIPLSGGRVPVRLDLPSLRDVAPSRATPTTVTFAPVIDARGADAAQIAVLRRDLKRMADDMPKTIAATLHKQQVRRTV